METARFLMLLDILNAGPSFILRALTEVSTHTKLKLDFRWMMYCMHNRLTSARSNRGATEITQFPLTLYCLFLVLFLPVLNLVTLLIAGTTALLATNDFAAKASTQATFAQALNAMAVESYNFQSNALAQFVKMSPQGGYTGCGNDLFILATDIGGTGVQSSAPDQSLNAVIDTTKKIYEMQVVGSYTVSPLVSLASVPVLGSVPGLGLPVLCHLPPLDQSSTQVACRLQPVEGLTEVVR